MTIEQWIKWAVCPDKRPHKFSSLDLARQYSRDAGVPLDHAAFRAAMRAAGYRGVRVYGQHVYYGARDSRTKANYIRRRWTIGDESARHPLAD